MDITMEEVYLTCHVQRKKRRRAKSEVLHGTLDLMALKVLDALGPQRGYGIARRIEQLSQQVLQLNEGTVYTSLRRLQRRKWIFGGVGGVGKQSQG
jgi:DNA-binding PadR family transcriptional regulator